MTPAVSVIVPLYNNLALTKAMVDSLLSTMPSGYAFEVILIDDCSTDGTREWLQTLSDPRLRPILNERNRGFAANNNIGARVARAPLLALLNNDLVLRPGWFTPMLEALVPGVGIVGNLQERAADGLLDHAGIRATALGKLEHIQTLPEPTPALITVLAVTGACCLLRRSDFLDSGGFDEVFINGSEDVDLCLRLRERGLSSVVATGSRIVHHVSASRGTISTRDERNSRLLITRWSEALTPEIAAAIHGPHAVLLARSALWREEARWARLLDGAPQQPCTPVTHRGFSRLSPLNVPAIPRRAVITLPPGHPQDALHLRVSRRIDLMGRLYPDAKIGLRVSINGIQTAEWEALPPGRHTLPIYHVASLPDRPTEVVLEPLVNVPGGGLAARLMRPLLVRLLRVHRILADDRPALELLRFK